jgi:hypothetical protein
LFLPSIFREAMGPNRRAQERERAAAARATERRGAVPATGVRGGRGGRDLLSGVGTLKSALASARAKSAAIMLWWNYCAAAAIGLS